MKKFEIKVNSIATDNAPHIVLAAEKLVAEKNEKINVRCSRT
jgi:hypothetical protein